MRFPLLAVAGLMSSLIAAGCASDSTTAPAAKTVSKAPAFDASQEEYQSIVSAEVHELAELQPQTDAAPREAHAWTFVAWQKVSTRDRVPAGRRSSTIYEVEITSPYKSEYTNNSQNDATIWSERMLQNIQDHLSRLADESHNRAITPAGSQLRSIEIGANRTNFVVRFDRGDPGVIKIGDSRFDAAKLKAVFQELSHDIDHLKELPPIIP